MAKPDPSPLLSPLGDLSSRQDFKDLIIRRIAAVREQKTSTSPLRESSSDALRSTESYEKDLLLDMLAKTQSLVKTLQNQLEAEKSDREQHIQTLTRMYEAELATLRDRPQDIHSFRDKSAAEVREVLVAEMRVKEADATQAAEKLRAEIQKLKGETSSLKLQLNAVQRDLEAERLLQPKTTEQQHLIKHLEMQVATLKERLDKERLERQVVTSLPISHHSESPSLPDFNVSEPESPKNDKIEAVNPEQEQLIAQLTAEKQKAEHAIELMLKMSSEKEAELTEEAERLRVLNSSFLEFSNKSEEWIKAGFQALTQKIDSLGAAHVEVSPGLERTVAHCEAVVHEAQQCLQEVESAESDSKGVLVEVLHALDQLQQHNSSMLQRCSVPSPHLDYPAELLASCTQLQKDLSLAHELQLQDHNELAKNLSFVASSAADREEELLITLQDRTQEVRMLREQLADFQDQHLQEELRMAKTTNGRLLAEVDTAKRYVLVLASCVQALQGLVTELAANPAADTSTALHTEMQRLQQENELLLTRMKEETEAHNFEVSTLQEETSRMQSEIRQLRSKLDQYHQIQTLKTSEDSNLWKDQVRLINLSNEQLRRNCTDLLAQSSKQRQSQFERAEIEGLRRIVELRNQELADMRFAAATNFQEILSELQRIKDQLEAPSQTVQKLTDFDQASKRVFEAAEGMVAYQKAENVRLKKKLEEIKDEIESFNKKLDDIAGLAKHLFSACGLKPIDVKENTEDLISVREKQYFAQSLEKLQTMHEAEVESFRQEVIQIEAQFNDERRRACELSKQLLDSMQYRQVVLDEMQEVNSANLQADRSEERRDLQTRLRNLDEEIERHQQWELKLADSLLRLLDKSSNAIEEANESSEVSGSDLSRLEADLILPVTD